ncbi:reverse transcriptase domain-containing protein [Tanacetum coccineum]
MAQDDEEKTTFYMDQGTYCYTKMPFGLNNAGATYQRLVDTAFQSQIRRNLEAYVDDMVIKSNDEKVLIADIAETFDNLLRINMKLNPKNYSFWVEEGKILGYMVTSEGIRANPTKTKAIADMQSPRTLKEMQSLNGKLVALKRFLFRSPERSLPFFKTLKDITKENKDEYRWTENAKKAFQEMKKVIVELPSLTTPRRKKRCILPHQSHNGPATQADTKQSLSIRETGQAPVGTPPEEFFRLPAQVQSKDDVERWALFTDGASNSKGSGAGLVLISPSGVEFTYALQLNFTSTNNEAEYEALLAGLRLAAKVQDIDVKVDLKLVASQVDKSYAASSTSMINYLATARECIAGLKSFTIQNIPRNLNQKANILSKLATHAFDHLMKEVLVEVL